MIKKNLKTLIITGIIILLPLIWGLIAYPTLPDQIPIHFDFADNVDGYGSKIFVLLISPMMLLIQWAAIVEAQIRSKKEEIKDGYIQCLSWTCAACAIACGVVLYNCIKGDLLTAQRLVPIIVGVVFIIMGNVTPKQKRNKWIGIRIKWTFDDPDNWMKTHRLFGKVSVLCGLAMIGLSFVKNISIAYAIMFALMLCAVFVPVAYSYVLNRNAIKNENKKLK